MTPRQGDREEGFTDEYEARRSGVDRRGRHDRRQHIDRRSENRSLKARITFFSQSALEWAWKAALPIIAIKLLQIAHLIERVDDIDRRSARADSVGIEDRAELHREVDTISGQVSSLRIIVNDTKRAVCAGLSPREREIGNCNSNND